MGFDCWKDFKRVPLVLDAMIVKGYLVFNFLDVDSTAFLWILDGILGANLIRKR